MLELLADLPGSVRLPTGSAEALLGLAADGDGLLELTAIPAGGRPTLAGRAHGAGIAGVRVRPDDLLADRRLFGAQPCLLGTLLVGVIQAAADFAAGERAQEHADAGHGQLAAAMPELRANQAAGSGAAEPANRLLGPGVLARRERQRERRHDGNFGLHCSRPSYLPPVPPTPDP